MKNEWLIYSIAGLAAIAYWKRTTIMSYAYTDAEALANKNVKKALALIKKYESNGSYTILYRPASNDPRFNPALPSHFSDFSAHPNVRVPFTTADGRPEISTAAGAYQINYPTWVTIQASRVASGRGSFSDFSPPSQDLAAIELMRMDGMLDYIIKGDWLNALVGMSKRWASMPMDTTGQSRLALNDALMQLSA